MFSIYIYNRYTISKTIKIISQTLNFVSNLHTNMLIHKINTKQKPGVYWMITGILKANTETKEFR